jgi:cobalt/nickel transport system permease protein
MWTATVATGAYCIKKIQIDEHQQPIALAGILGAFVFAAQMINFSIPGTGSSGHIGGGLLLALLLGPHLGFLTMAAILLIQALFFADGGLLSYGCNVFNLAFYTCFFAYPYIYKPLAAKGRANKGAIIASAVIGLQMGAFSVVLETLFSGKTELPFTAFVLLMQPIHLAIGIVEGLITAAIVAYVEKTAPELLNRSDSLHAEPGVQSPPRTVLQNIAAVFIVATLLTGGVLSWFASAHPDGLEWSIEGVTGSAELEDPSPVHRFFSSLQNALAPLPDYTFKQAGEAEEHWPAVDAGTSLSGIVGAVITFMVVFLTGLALKPKKGVIGSTSDTKA